MPSAASDFARRALLPAGLRDLLPEEAEAQEALAALVMGCFSQWGYRRVDPPLVEYEDSLLADASGRLARQSFRLLDPASQKMMGVRADLTPQIARIAATRLHNAPRPLRLRYVGDCLRVQGEQLRPERQVLQAGAELIGADGLAAELEAASLAIAGLRAAGLEGVTIDLSAAPLAPMVLAAHGVTGDAAAALREALERKDAQDVARLAVDPALGAALLGLLRAVGPAERGVKILESLALPDEAVRLRAHLAHLSATLLEQPGVEDVTLDPVESRGFEYYAGVGFTLFARGAFMRGAAGELGRGGRYWAGWGERREPAVGFTLFLDAVARVAPAVATTKRIFAPYGATADHRLLRQDGWVVVAGLTPTADPRAEARRLGCDWIALNGACERLEQVDLGQ